MSDFLPYSRHVVEQDDVEAVCTALGSGRLTTGPAVDRFESLLAERVGARYAVACSSGTAALHLACAALGIGPGDRVVVPAITFLATANAVRFVGADPVFADVDPSTGLMGPQHLEAAIAAAGGASVRAVLPVHLNGQTGGLDGLANIARHRGITVVEDACHALGTIFHGPDDEISRVGDCRFAAAAVFSFHPAKTVAMGEGGALTTNDEQLADRFRLLRNHGMVRDSRNFVNTSRGLDSQGQPNPWYYEMHDLGFNYRASDLQCALGASQLERLERIKLVRGNLMRRYDARLASLAPIVQPVPRSRRCDPTLHLYAVLIDFAAARIDRGELMRRLRERDIGTQVHFFPVPWQPYYRNLYGEMDLPGAEAYYERVLSLPFHAAMTGEDVDRVVAAIVEVLEA